VDTEVVIAGAGPTGLLLAYELTLAGVDVTVLDRLEQRTGQSKALNLQPRSAEILDLRGLLEPLLDVAVDRIPAGHFAGLPVPLDYSVLDTRYRYQVGIPQARVEQLLEDRLAERGVKVHYGQAVDRFAQSDAGVSVNHDIRAQFLVGCDGAHSTVRKQLGVAFPGRDPRMSAIVADLTLDNGAAPSPGWKLPDLTPRDGAVVNLLPIQDGVFRLLAAGPEQQAKRRDEPVTAEEVQRALGPQLRLGELRWASRFTDTTRQAERYRVGRVLLAGDAAHVHPPTGGQGLNLGLQDAFNLGWKLAAEVRGTAPHGLLDSYHAERHPVAARVLANTRAQGVLMVPDDDVAALRGTFAELLRLPDTNRHLAEMISGLDVAYAERMPDLDLVVDGARTRVSRLLHAGRAVELHRNGETVLIRPDGYIACAGAGIASEVVYSA
jgi:2-polyprenyl-6-methoxyphenol hydroxylase-like FAD-dependent oxidoreductase